MVLRVPFRWVMYVFITAVLVLAAGSVRAAPQQQGDQDPPGIAERFPAPGANRVWLDSVDQPFVIRVEFDELMDHSTIRDNSLRLRAQGSSSDIPIEITSIGPAADNANHTEVVWSPIPPVDPRDPMDPDRVIFGGVTYTATLFGDVEDLSGNALGSSVSWSFYTHPDYVGDSQAHQFAGGTIPPCMELLSGPELAPSVLAADLVLKGSGSEDFNGSVLPAGWTVVSGSPVLSGSVLRLDGAQVTGTGHALQPESSAFFFAILGGQVGQQIGLVGGAGNANALAALVVESTAQGPRLFARTRTNAGAEQVSGPLPVDYASGGFRYSIRRMNDRVIYDVFFNGGDRVELANHALAVGGTMHPFAADASVGSTLQVPWVSMMSSGSASPCTYLSRVRRTDRLADWTELFWMGSRDGVTFQTRSGMSPTPDGTWSGWADVNPTTRLVTSPNGSYIQYQMVMQPDGIEPRWLENVWIEYQGIGPVIAFDFILHFPLIGNE